ncbi:aminotransferase class V-fold PLP-dependent enzyme [Streptomyces noursei]|uniref:aminotransferase class V-fold PLP-dependent enzyme n=1 Tax=Streptomyces noursei TaxID=1971 RepID=UPI0016723EF1|nr:aminotransferase class V-fold PLP-dependent enzyme [Streptomyces noursei]MCZ1019107.1 aminotransferase class V-fold PLP-dependent enzyme [Streptomyces noursei]GGX31673.1 cysteine desulfurase [Streptomyces noursei]
MLTEHPASIGLHHRPGRVPRVVGSGLTVPLVTGRRVPYVNLDHAASTPCMVEVRQGVERLLPWYSSVHRGAGFTSQVSTRTYERARDTVRRFVGAAPDATVVFTRNTTDALNLLGRAVPPHTTVFRFATDHHAALLAWRGSRVCRLGVPAGPGQAVELLAGALADAPPGPRLVVLTGASNVTGELWPVAALAEVAAAHGARTVLDAAQLAAHGPVHLTGWGVDWVALSGHKMYAPFGAGALVGAADWLAEADPYLAGGGATARVTADGGRETVVWSGLPHRHEAGSPNVVGAHAMAVACEALSAAGWDAITAHERALAARLRDGLARIPGVCRLGMWDAGSPAVGVVSFGVARCGGEPVDQRLVATALSAEHGIGVRDGAFCAHQAVRALLCRAHPHEPGRALRASIGLGTTADHVDRLLSALAELVADGPRWTYRNTPDGWCPVPDPRPLPDFLTHRDIPEGVRREQVRREQEGVTS